MREPRAKVAAGIRGESLLLLGKGEAFGSQPSLICVALNSDTKSRRLACAHSSSVVIEIDCDAVLFRMWCLPTDRQQGI